MATTTPREGSDPGPILKGKTYAVFEDGEGKRSLPELCLGLLANQKNAWPDLQEGYGALERVMERAVPCGGFSVRLQFNPGRIKSSTADVGKKEAKARECFLCRDNLPESQKGVLYRSEYLILCNPAPIFPGHFTISHVTHRPQSLHEHIPVFLQLVSEFGCGWTVFYNGARCGASAPQHLHFQAVPSGRMPIEKEIWEERRLGLIMKGDGFLVYRGEGLGREVVAVEGCDPIGAGRAFETISGALKAALGGADEPMMNVAGLYEEEKWRLLIYPRRKHRPDAFSREGDARVVVSPGLIDMGGVIITPVRKDFERLDAASVEGIYKEVSLEAPILERALKAAFA